MTSVRMGALCTGVLGPYDFNDAENSGRNLVGKKGIYYIMWNVMEFANFL